MDAVYDRQVIGRIATGDEEALRDLHRRNAQTLYNYAVRVLRSGDEAEEAVGAVFLSVWTGTPPWPDPPRAAAIELAARLRASLLARLGDPRRRDFRDIDLWSRVAAGDGPVEDPGTAADPGAGIRLAVFKGGVVSAAVLSLTYFSGYSVAEAAAKLSIADSECRSRLQVGLERIAAAEGGSKGVRRELGCRMFSGYNAAIAMGAMAAADDPAYLDHRRSGCRHCDEEVARYEGAAHRLPGLLAEVRLPEESFERILFSLRLAGLAGDGPVADGPREFRGGNGGDIRPEDAAVPSPFPRAEAPPARHRGAAAVRRERSGRYERSGRLARALVVATLLSIGALLFLASYVRNLTARIDDQAEVIDAMQGRNAELLVKYDRLAGVSGFFETNGVVTALKGTGEYPGLAGRIVWDTAGGTAMLQVLDPPPGFAGGRIRVSVLDGDALVPLAEFPGGGGEAGGALYRFFSVDSGPRPVADGFVVDLAPRGSEGGFSSVLSGEVAARR